MEFSSVQFILFTLYTLLKCSKLKDEHNIRSKLYPNLLQRPVTHTSHEIIKN